MILAIDFDDVIHNPHDVLPGYKMGKPIDGAINEINKLYREGNQIIIHTIWATTPQRTKAIIDWCTYFNIPFNKVTNIKPEADVYLDNKAIHFSNWKQAMRDIGELRED